MRILLIGQCTLHWGRLEFGNIGTYYVIEPFIRELHRVFPDSEIFTTFQFSDEFCMREMVVTLPMQLFYGFNDQEDLHIALSELASVEIFKKTGNLPYSTPYIEEVIKSDIVIDFSGDMWGDNANFIGKNRFLIGQIKNRIAQLLDRSTVLLAVSAGPFNKQNTLEFAQQVFKDFDFVTIREPLSLKVLNDFGFNTSKVLCLACPSFLFEASTELQADKIIDGLELLKKESGLVGLIICGWNFAMGPFNKWPRPDEDYIQFAETIEFITQNLGLQVCLMSHANGFRVPPAEFKKIHGRDYLIIKQLETILRKRGIAKNYFTLDGVYDPWQTKTIISHFDMLISGRIHGAIAALSQDIPTVVIDYGHEPKAHKLLGFTKLLGIEEYLADPFHSSDMIDKIAKCWKFKDEIRVKLKSRIPEVRNLARQNFDMLPKIFLERKNNASNELSDC